MRAKYTGVLSAMGKTTFHNADHDFDHNESEHLRCHIRRLNLDIEQMKVQFDEEIKRLKQTIRNERKQFNQAMAEAGYRMIGSSVVASITREGK